MQQTIPDGTLCLVVRGPQRFQSLIGTCVIVTFEPDWTLWKGKETYDIGHNLVAERQCLLPIPPKDDDAETRNTEVPKEVPA